MKEIATNFKRS